MGNRKGGMLYPFCSGDGNLWGMTRSRFGRRGRLALFCVLAMVVGLGSLPAAGTGGLPWNPPGRQVAAAAPAIESRFYPQTGFAVRDRDGVSFLSEFDRLGGPPLLGYPVSRVFEAGGFLRQAFQRGILQWRADTGTPALVNVMDLLFDAGMDGPLLQKGVPAHLTGDDGSGGDFGRAREIRLGWLTEPAVQRAYLSSSDPLSFYGLPTSRPERHGPFVAQRFQRGVLQLWVDEVPGMPAPGRVVGVLAGDLAIESGLVPKGALTPEHDELEADIFVGLLVPRFQQQRNLSCESSAAAMAAAYFGVALTERQIVAEIPLDPNPHRGFRGNIDSWFGGLDQYGVYAEPVARVLSNHGLRAEAVYDLTLEALRDAVNHNRIVVAWITYQTAVRTPVVRTIGGEQVTLVPWEHAVTVVGYDRWGVHVNDPATGGTAYYSNEDFLRASGYFDGMAVVVSP